MIEPQTLNANGFVISRSIARHAIALAQKGFGFPTFGFPADGKDLRWRCGRRQLVMALEAGIVDLSIPMSPAAALVNWRQTICGILTIVDPRVPDDGLELWNGDTRLVAVSGLALSDQESPTPA